MPVTSRLPVFIRINDYLGRVDQSMEKAAITIAASKLVPDQTMRDTILEGGISRALHDVYSAYEKIFEDIALEVDGGLPQGEHWHRKLQLQMQHETEIRPAVIPAPLTEFMDQLRGFRHVFRSSYGGDLRIPELLEKHAALRDGVIHEMLKSLQSLADALILPDPFVRNSSEPSQNQKMEPD